MSIYPPELVIDVEVIPDDDVAPDGNVSTPTPRPPSPRGEPDGDSARLTRRALLIGGAVAVGGFATFVAASTGVMRAISQLAGNGGVAQPTALALGEIPVEYLQLYMASAERWSPGLSWTVLAAIGWVETRHGSHPTMISSVGAQGPMQFMPATWAAYGIDADGDGVANVWSPADAIAGAANYLYASGAGNPATLRQAIWHYNHDWEYVDMVLAKAAQYGSAAANGIPITIAGVTGNPAALLGNPRVTMPARAAADLVDPRMDPRVIALLEAIAQAHAYNIVVLATGHSLCVGGGNAAPCNVSNHAMYRAVDISPVDGAIVGANNPGALAVVQWLASLQGPLRPSEVGSPWRIPSPGHFTDRFHQRHIHIGYDTPA
ncbi:MAG: lytic transglycosylase domain-containing protein [Egibacteraceae bacterium]